MIRGVLLLGLGVCEFEMNFRLGRVDFVSLGDFGDSFRSKRVEVFVSFIILSAFLGGAIGVLTIFDCTNGTFACNLL